MSWAVCPLSRSRGPGLRRPTSLGVHGVFEGLLGDRDDRGVGVLAGQRGGSVRGRLDRPEREIGTPSYGKFHSWPERFSTATSFQVALWASQIRCHLSVQQSLFVVQSAWNGPRRSDGIMRQDLVLAAGAACPERLLWVGLEHQHSALEACA